MRLNGLDKLLARLNLKILPGQREKLVACARLPRAVESSIGQSTIKYLRCVRKRSPSIEEFLKTLKVCFKTLDDSHDLLDLLDRFDRAYPCLNELDEEPKIMVSRSTASEDQKAAFSRILVRMSSELSGENLEILVALCPTPEGGKESLTSGVKLFNELQCYGCITAENTDLLDDLFRVLKLARLMELLNEYRETYAVTSPPADLDRQISFGSGLSPSLPSAPPNLRGSRNGRTFFTQTQHYQGLSNKYPQHSILPAQNPQKPLLPPAQPHPPAISSPVHQETTPFQPGTPILRIGRPINTAHKTPTTPAAGRTGDQHPFPSAYDDVSPQLSHNGSPHFRPPKEPFRSLHPPPVNEVTPSAPPLPHMQAQDDNSTISNFTPRESGELFQRPEPVRSGPIVPPLPHAQAQDNNSTISNFTPRESGELFQRPEPVRSGPIVPPQAQDNNSTISNFTPRESGELFQRPEPVRSGPIVPSAAAKGTLSAGKFPSKELNKTPEGERFKTAASTHQNTTFERSTLQSYRHVSNLPEAVERQHTDEGAEEAAPRGTSTTAVPREDSKSTIPMVQLLAVLDQEKAPLAQTTSPVLTSRKLNAGPNFTSVNTTATSLPPESNDEEYYSSSSSSERTTPPFDDPSSPVGEETTRHSRKRSGEELTEEMAGPTKRRQPPREAANRSMVASFASSVKSFLGYK